LVKQAQRKWRLVDVIVFVFPNFSKSLNPDGEFLADHGGDSTVTTGFKLIVFKRHE
jgi:hypothetical protein